MIKPVFNSFWYKFYQNETEQHPQVCTSGISDESYQRGKKIVNGQVQGKNLIGYKIHWWENCIKTWAIVYSNCSHSATVKYLIRKKVNKWHIWLGFSPQVLQRNWNVNCIFDTCFNHRKFRNNKKEQRRGNKNWERKWL